MSHRPLVGYLVSHPIQYHAPLFRRLAESSVLDFVALFGIEATEGGRYDTQFGRQVDFGLDLLRGYRWRRVAQASRNPRIDAFWSLRTPSLNTIWEVESPDVLVLHGWRTAMMWQAALGAVFRRTPYLVRAETPILQHATTSRRLHDAARAVCIRPLVRRAAGVLSLGTANDRFYRSLGIAPHLIFRVPYSVDNGAVKHHATLGRQQRSVLRARFAIPEGAFLAITAAKLIPRKRPLDLLHALAQLPEKTHLLWIGSGELQDPVREEAQRLGLTHRVHLPGFCSSPMTWTLLGIADIFLLPSGTEPWGLAINEAVAAGLPTIVSDACGAAEDLVRPDRTGHVVRTGDIGAWVGAINTWLGRAEEGTLRSVATLSDLAALADRHSLEATARGIENTVTIVSTP